MAKKVTITMIANNLDTSVTTVSRVISNSTYPVEENLKKKILKEAEQLGYVPPKKNTNYIRSYNEICVVIPNMSNPYYNVLLQGIEEVASKYNYNLVLFNSNRNPISEKKFIKTLIEKNVKGTIIVSINGNDKNLAKYIDAGNHVVCLEQDISLECSKIGYNFYDTGRLAAKYFYDLGHKKIALIIGSPTFFSRKQIKKGFEDTLKGYGLYDSKNIFVGNSEEKTDSKYEFNSAREQVDKLIKLGKNKMPTAIFCANDIMALGVIHHLKLNGFNVPNDISVMGFDNIPYSEISNPNLTTIDQCGFEMGSTACETLIKKMKGDITSEISTIFEPKVIERASTRSL